MKRNQGICKFFAWALCLVMLFSVTFPVLAAPEEDAPPAPAAEVQEPSAKEEPAKDENPAQDQEPAKDETPVQDEEPTKEDAPAQDEEPTKEDTPVQDEEPAKEETPTQDEEPAKDENPAQDQEPAKEETPVQDEEPSAEPHPSASARLSATLSSAGIDADAPDNGFSFDWSQEDVRDSGWDSSHGVVKTSRGYYLYFETGEWGSAALSVYTPDDPYAPVMNFVTNAGDKEHLVNGLDGNAVWEEAEVHYYTSGGRRYTEAFVPAELLPEGELTFICNDASFLFAAPVSRAADGDEEVQPTPEPVYTGIVIDGQFDDWAAVPRYEIDDGKGYNTADHVAVVWDGDWVYILLTAEGDRDWQGNLTGAGNWNSVTNAGTHGNGQFAITTDLGRTLLVQPVVDNYYEPAVSGVDGAKAAVNNKDWEGAPHLWELAIPTSELPEYLETISFGFYLSEPTITGISNMQDNGGGVDPFAANVTIDGKYDDWVGYPHTLIQYDRQGIQHHLIDGEAALWSDDGWLYGHVVTEHPDHLDEQGSCYLAAISIAFNGDRSYKEWPADGNFYPRILAIAEDGTVTDFYKTLNEGHSLPQGIHTFYIFDIRTDPIAQFSTYDESNTRIAAPTAAELIENAFGTMKVTVTGTKDDMEFDLDLRKVADYIGADAGDFKTIEAQFGRIGPQWVTTAGTPTGPVLGVALAVGAVGAPVCYNEFKRRRSKKEGEGEAREQ